VFTGSRELASGGGSDPVHGSTSEESSCYLRRETFELVPDVGIKGVGSGRSMSSSGHIHLFGPTSEKADDASAGVRANDRCTSVGYIGPARSDRRLRVELRLSALQAHRQKAASGISLPGNGRSPVRTYDPEPPFGPVQPRWRVTKSNGHLRLSTAGD
jgi:hypothetical protein